MIRSRAPRPRACAPRGCRGRCSVSSGAACRLRQRRSPSFRAPGAAMAVAPHEAGRDSSSGSRAPGDDGDAHRQRPVDAGGDDRVEGSAARLVIDFPNVSSRAPAQTIVDGQLVNRVRIGVNSHEPLVTRAVMEIAATARRTDSMRGDAGSDLAVIFDEDRGRADRRPPADRQARRGAADHAGAAMPLLTPKDSARRSHSGAEQRPAARPAERSRIAVARGGAPAAPLSAVLVRTVIASPAAAGNRRRREALRRRRGAAYRTPARRARRSPPAAPLSQQIQRRSRRTIRRPPDQPRFLKASICARCCELLRRSAA